MTNNLMTHRLFLLLLLLGLLLATSADAQPVPLLPKEPPSTTINSDPPTLYKQWWLAARNLHKAAIEQAGELERLREQLAGLQASAAEAQTQYKRITMRWQDMPVDRPDGSPVPFTDSVYVTKIEPLSAEEFALQAPAPEPISAPVPVPEPPPEEQAVTTAPFSIEAELPARKLRSAVNPETETSALSSGGMHVAFWGPGQWLEYDLPAVEAGGWTMVLRVASAAGGSSILVSLDGATVATVAVPATGGWTSWVQVEVALMLTRGAHLVRLTAVTTGWVGNIDTLRFSMGAATGGGAASPAGQRLLFGHEMMAMPPAGGGTSQADVDSAIPGAWHSLNLRLVRHHALDRKLLFPPAVA